MYYTYILRCEDNSLYTGIATDVQRRFEEHLNDEKKGAKYTKRHRPIRIEACWESEDKKTASKLEYHIKALDKYKKELLIAENRLELLGNKIEISNYKRIMLTNT